MPKTSISKINSQTCPHEATMFIAQQAVNWNELALTIARRMKTLEKRGELPNWADMDNVYAMMVVALLQRFSVQLMIAQESHEQCYDLAKSLYESFGLSEQLSELMADFLLANDSIRDAVTKRLRDRLSNLPWENN